VWLRQLARQRLRSEPNASLNTTGLEPVIELDEALQRLAALDERRSRILEQRYFGGLSLEETAEALGVSLATVKRELRAARAWLAVELGRDAS
jgi:RNA polymerase sigma factor (sigma-70 family)